LASAFGFDCVHARYARSCNTVIGFMQDYTYKYVEKMIQFIYCKIWQVFTDSRIVTSSIMYKKQK